MSAGTWKRRDFLHAAGLAGLAAFAPLPSVHAQAGGGDWSADFARALGVDATPPAGGTQVALQVLTGVAVAEGRGPDLANALTGRTALPIGYNLLI